SKNEDSNEILIKETSKNTEVCNQVNDENDRDKTNNQEDDDSLEYWYEELIRRAKIFREQKLAAEQNEKSKDDQEIKECEIINNQPESTKTDEKIQNNVIENSSGEINDKKEEIIEDEFNNNQTEGIAIEDSQNILPRENHEKKSGNTIHSFDKLTENISKEDKSDSSEMVTMQEIKPSNSSVKEISEKKESINDEQTERITLSTENELVMLEIESLSRDNFQQSSEVKDKCIESSELSLKGIYKSIKEENESDSLYNETQNGHSALSKIQLNSSEVLGESQCDHADFNNEIAHTPIKINTEGCEPSKPVELVGKTEFENDDKQYQSNIINKNNTSYERINQNARDIIRAHVIEKGFFSNIISTIMNELCCCLGEQNNTNPVNSGIYELIDHITKNFTDKDDIYNLPCEDEKYLEIIKLIRRNEKVNFKEFNLNQCILALKKYLRDELDGLIDAEMSKIILNDLFERGDEGEKLILEYGKLVMSQDRLLLLTKIIKMFMKINNNES
ncbi:hypothetical protein DMUE_5729, partial [Dictyocoela muelleri]